MPIVIPRPPNTGNAGILAEGERALLSYIDTARAEAGVAELTLIADFVVASRLRADVLSEQPELSHAGMDVVSQRLRAQGWTWTLMYEALAISKPTPEIAFADLMDSPTHRAALMNDRALFVGIGQSGASWAVHFFRLP